jgi:hypothetical protein
MMANWPPFGSHNAAKNKRNGILPCTQQQQHQQQQQQQQWNNIGSFRRKNQTDV